MADKPQTGRNAGKSGSREARLAAALRENLRRRKQQERARARNTVSEPQDREPGKERPR